MSLSRGHFSFLLRVFTSVCCLGVFACIASANSLYSLSVCFFICYFKFVVLNAALLLPPRETVVLQMLHVAVGLLSRGKLKILTRCRYFIHKFARVTLRACLRSAPNCALTKKKKKKSDWAHTEAENGFFFMHCYLVIVITWLFSASVGPRLNLRFNQWKNAHITRFRSYRSDQEIPS